MFEIQCTNKGCMQLQKPKINLETDEVICAKCGKPIDNINRFIKSGMKSIGQTTKGGGGNKKAFALNCPACSKMEQPNIAEGDKLLCKFCGAEFKDVSAPYKQAMLGVLKGKK